MRIVNSRAHTGSWTWSKTETHCGTESEVAEHRRNRTWHLQTGISVFPSGFWLPLAVWIYFWVKLFTVDADIDADGRMGSGQRDRQTHQSAFTDCFWTVPKNQSPWSEWNLMKAVQMDKWFPFPHKATQHHFPTHMCLWMKYVEIKHATPSCHWR